MIEHLADIPGWFIGVLSLMGMLLVSLGFFARRDGYVAGLRDADLRNRQQQQHDFNRGRVDGVRETLAHLRDTGQLVEFRQPPTEALPHRR